MHMYACMCSYRVQLFSLASVLQEASDEKPLSLPSMTHRIMGAT